MANGDRGPGPRRVGVVGLGLMGGSLALALARAGVAVVGVDPDDGARALLAERLPGSLLVEVPDATLASCDLVVLAVPLAALERAAGALLPCLGGRTVVTDLTSVKVAPLSLLAQVLPGVRVVGGHPMAGRERSGAAFADPDLFVGRPWAVVPGGLADRPALALVRALATSVGAQPVEVSASAHDGAVAATSHLPYLLSGALARAAERLLGDGLPVDRLAGPGLDGMLRLAAQPAWMDSVASANAANVALALEQVNEELESLGRALAAARRGDATALAELGARGRAARARLAAGAPKA